jgi:hypothetical protein
MLVYPYKVYNNIVINTILNVQEEFYNLLIPIYLNLFSH